MTPATPRDAAGADPGRKALVRYVRRNVFPYSAHYRRLLDRDGGGRFGEAVLDTLGPTDLREIDDAGALVLRPGLGRILREGDRRFAARTAAAKLLGGMHRYNRRVVERRFKPVQWVMVAGVPIGYSASDLDLLAAHGTAWLERAGVDAGDVLVSLLPPGPHVAYWQAVLGCRRRKISALHLGPGAAPALVAGLAPTVVAGEPPALLALLQGAQASGHQLALRTVLVAGPPLSAEVRASLAGLAGGAAVVGAWAPEGVRSLWSECRPGAPSAAGYHAWDGDVLEAAPDDRGAPGPAELWWTGTRWRGSALVRLRTFTRATVERGACPGCGRTGPRVVPYAPVGSGVPEAPVPAPKPEVVVSSGADSPDGPFEAVLDGDGDVVAWQVELRVVGGTQETIVFLAPAWGTAVVPLVRRLDRYLRATQFVVEDAGAVADRVARAGGRRIVRPD